ncbi:MAG: M60 family metallopeptidase [Paraprevotella sp.]|nr:M60 family metallopeptidase [Paraprevotella sp.]
MKNKALYILGAIAGFLGVQGVSAQTPADNHPTILLSAQNANIAYRDTTLYLKVRANNDYNITSSHDWISAQKSANGQQVYVAVKMNTDSEERSATLSFSDKDNNVTRTFTVTQARESTAELLEGDHKMAVSSAEASEQNSTGNGISRSYDGSYGSYYHSNYSTTSTSFPVTLTYNFTDVERIDYITYVPRQDGTVNGNFEEVEVWYMCQGNAEYTKHGVFNLRGSSSASNIYFQNPLMNPTSIKFVVNSGKNNFVACAEMEFYRKRDNDPNHAIFADDLWTTLKEGTTQEDIDALTNPFCKLLAQKLFDGTYNMRWRVADYECRLNPSVLSEQWNTPGKLYDQMDGPTGINISKGKSAVIVSGIPQGLSATLKVMAWFAKELDSEGVGGGPAMSTFPLKNGINVIEYTNDYDGLAYVCYNADENPEAQPNIKVHFVNGIINGYLHPELTNEEMYQICSNATNVCMDVYGKKVHSVWTSKGLRDFCKASDGSSRGYRQYMNLLDSLIQWEHRHMGLEKYNRIPTNRTMAYVNYTYYMFQGGYGVSFMYDQEARVLNCRNLMHWDHDAIWGLSHEWGHQHQMHPYLCWAGMSEVTNNLFSYYNIFHMGYYDSDKIQQWQPARNHFINNKRAFTPTCGADDYYKSVYYQRLAISEPDIVNYYSYSPKMKAMCAKMADYTKSIPAANSAEGAHAIGITEVGVGEILCPFIMLANYAEIHMNYPDLIPDLHESLRQNDDVNGSQIEKKGEVDKYELIASAQNDNKKGKLAVLKEKYPNSCWITDNYITDQYHNRWDNSVPYILNFIRKTSRLLGYNLFPYFDEWGFLRRVALRVGDYGNKNIIMTQEMYDEFKADMDALVESGELKAMPEGMVKTISDTRDLNLSNDMRYPTPNIPN